MKGGFLLGYLQVERWIDDFNIFLLSGDRK
jgi:hypothetical protein